jgi:flavodoxin
MRSVVIYYSYSGNTKRVAGVLSGYLKERGETQEIELIALDESKSFFGQGRRAFKRVRAKIQEVNPDVSGFDLVCLGTPVWAFAPVPAMNAFLDQCLGMEGKEIVLFTTYGSGSGNERCLKIMQQELAKKGAKSFRQFSIQQLKTKDKELILSEIGKILGKQN